MTSRSGRLWSSWDMLVREAPPFVKAVSVCERVFALVRYGKNEEELDKPLGDELRSRGKQHMDQLAAAIDGMNLKATIAVVLRTKKALEDNDKMTLKDFGHANEDIHSRFHDEMAGRNFLFLDDREAQLFEGGKPPFGEEVADKFPAASFDLEEADKCLAVSRYTACLFHLMRAAESVAVSVAAKLGATTLDENGEQLSLGILTANIDAKIAKMPKGPKKDDWLKVPYLLHSCNRAYRTKTAHPADVYTDEQAERARQATCALLQEFAELLSE